MAQDKLRWYALVTGLVHLTRSILYVVFASNVDFDYTWTTDYLQMTGGVRSTVYETIWTVNIAYVIAVFPLISALAQFIYVWTYDRWQGPQFIFFFMEYSLSVPVMISTIAQLCGITNVWLHFMLAVCMFLMCWIGALAEVAGPDLRWPLFWTGWVPFAAAFLVVFTYFGRASGGDPPAFVYVAVYGLFTLFALFPIVTIIDYRGYWKKHTVVAAYVTLSLVAKSVLDIDVYFGAAAQ